MIPRLWWFIKGKVLMGPQNLLDNKASKHSCYGTTEIQRAASE